MKRNQKIKGKNKLEYDALTDTINAIKDCLAENINDLECTERFVNPTLLIWDVLSDITQAFHQQAYEIALNAEEN